ncbi:MAG: excinuclease ABC subunit UvrA, partial [Proteobacteria bacterium]|nr:excinuclease ABC subunit UvrA [Pseudomonadota bacterium]
KMGFYRVYHEGAIRELSSSLLDSCQLPEADIMVDRLVISQENKKRMVDSLEMALKFGKGLITIFFPEPSAHQAPIPPQKFSNSFHCPQCNITYTNPFPNLFSFNSPLGACSTCNGFGKTIGIDFDAVIPDQCLSLQDDAVKPWATPAYREAYYDLMAFCKKEKIPAHIPFKDLPHHHRDKIINGSDGFCGIKGFFDWLETKTYKMHIRVLLSKYRGYSTCSSCTGSRFQPETLLYRIDGKTIADIYVMSIKECHAFFEHLDLDGFHDKAGELLLQEIRGRLGYLKEAGLGYLTLDRQSRTLSGGEVERARLTTALGSSLVNTLYVLDEPSIGLHPRDNHRLIGILKGLRDTGNTIVVVEHDPDIILNSDTVIDLGPRAGEHGGRLLYMGTPEDLLTDKHSLTGSYLAGDRQVPVPATRRKPEKGFFLRIKGAAQHNLKHLNLSIPLGVLVCITGVSGSGKSTLLENSIYQGLLRKTGEAGEGSDPRCSISGAEQISRVVLMDQSPIGRTPRSNPVTYLKIFDDIRKLFSRERLSHERSYTASTFSFNSKGGRCEQCQGEGFEKIEMQFLSDVYVRCSQCQGKRYTAEVLDVTCRNKNIHEVLEMTVSEARAFFSTEERLRTTLELLDMVGLGYVRLGQPINTLSGGESQRLKIASLIQAGRQGRTLFLFDEPTTGLHFEDIKKLLSVFDLLIEQGHSLIVVEHNLDFIKCADHIIDLGPEGGDDGGHIVAQGPPEKILRCPHSYTGTFLHTYLNKTLPGGLPAAYSSTQGKETISSNGCIAIDGAREHNLKNISVRIPREQIVVITGLSGSGKSTLAFDILFAEGQRRFLETLSPFARQYIKQFDRPEVDSLRGIPPTVAIEQRLSQGGNKSTVATLTEIYHYLRLLYAKTGDQHCPSCGALLTSQSPQTIADDIIHSFTRKQVAFLAPLVKGRKGFHKGVIEKAKRDGYEKIRINGQLVNLRSIFAVKRYQEHQIELVTAELRPSKKERHRVLEEANKALQRGRGTLYVVSPGGTEKVYSTSLSCARCEISLEEPDPRLFSFNSRQGACSECSGTGTFVTLSPELLAPDRQLSISGGGIIPLASALIDRSLKKRIIHEIETKLNISSDVSLQKLPASRIHALFYGSTTGKADAYPGLLPILHESVNGSKTAAWSQYLSQFYREMPCPACSGTRLNPLALSVKLNGRSIADVTTMTPDEARNFLTLLSFTGKKLSIAEPILKEITQRLAFLSNVGLSYLTLNRAGDTLSGGEAQRIRLAAQMGSNLRGVAYILDEPTIGLHPHDNKNLLGILRNLQEKGNSLIIVEHDEETIKSADFIVDLGKGGGIHGGRVVATGTPQDIMHCRESITGACLSRTNGDRNRHAPRPLNGCSRVTFVDACEHNLKHITVRFPVERLSVVTGVSGSGKSTLVKETVYKGIKKLVGSYHGRAGAHKKIIGGEQFKRVVEIDQSPIGKTPRSTPATYIGFYSEIRRLFSLLPEAQIRGFSSSRFSFNLSGGRCEKCSGQGKIKMEMSFLPDVYVACDVCQGSRFNEETLNVLLKGKNISQVLFMTVDEGCDFFQGF